jgi:hypothetical protein
MNSFYIQILLTAVSVSFAIVVLFFTYTKTIEKQVMFNISEDISEYIKAPFVFIPSEYISDIKNKLKQYEENTDSSKSDAKIKRENDELMYKSYTIFGIIFALGLILTYIITRNTDLFINSLEVTAVAITIEVLFLILIFKNYKFLDLNQVKSHLSRHVKKKVDSLSI